MAASPRILKQLVSFGADVRAEDIQGRTPFHLIAGIVAADDDFPYSLRRSTGPISDKGNVGITTLLERLVTAGADVNATSPSGWTPLHYFINQHGNENLIQDLIRASADINAKDNAGLTPLHYSVRRGRRVWERKLAEELIANGANIHAQDASHRTPIDVMFEDALRLPGCRVDSADRDMQSWTPLHKAVIADEWEFAKMLVLQGADINEKDNGGRTALHIAFALSTSYRLISDFWKPFNDGPIGGGDWHINFCSKLLDFGVDVSAKTFTGLTALHIAADAKVCEPIERMVALGAGLDERDHFSRTALYFAAAQDYQQVVEVLLKLGADARIQDEAGISPLRRAQEGTHANSSATARVLRAHLQKDESLSRTCEVGTGHVGDDGKPVGTTTIYKTELHNISHIRP
ncbi:ankyrin repeat [Trichoderma arundinaceum]|uniref:Ankyrin repeat n=1 Tax=Trichoderma arundinaceum TaxID=490622 RepID=A0A395NLZ6_TRIAR|nr:ankyrin repeat [Trichoderma arundinaceum]